MSEPRLHLLDDTDPNWFPGPELALEEPNGLLAIGGDLSPQRLRAAYARGIFPWFEEGQPPLWWSPDPRSVLYPGQLRITRSLRKRIRNGGFSVTLDRCFADVITACAGPRDGSHGTWITEEMREAYINLHRQGLAHSVEAWRGGQLVGGLYGLAMGRAFFGESMFSREPDASKIALVYLVRQVQVWGYAVIDCQVSNPHLALLGATDIPRADFLRQLRAAGVAEGSEAADAAPWIMDAGFDPLQAGISEQQ